MTPIGGPDDASPTSYRVDAPLMLGLGWHLGMYEEALTDRDRVIARLLDGWQHNTEKLFWFRPRGPISELDPEVGSMSDGEAAIIRQHQGKTQ